MRALIIGGTGLVGRAIARRLIKSGWRVDLTGRDPAHLPADLAAAGAGFIPADRSDAAALQSAFGAGADLLVDCICYTSAEARLLLPLVANAGSTVMISSKAVYVDDDGNHPNSPNPPRFAGPVTESQATLPPDDRPYNSPEGYGRNKIAAERVLLDSGAPVTVLRPSKIHGEGAARPREWVFVRRVLDQRPTVLLAHRGAGGDHTTASANLAALVELVASKPGLRILNSADPDAPNGRQIAQVIARHLGHEWEEVLLDGPAELGRHPWDKVPPIVLDTSAATALGYAPVGTYAATVSETVDWLVAAARAGDPEGILPRVDDPYFARYFDYAAEDAR